MRSRLVSLLVVLCLVAAACGDDDDDAEAPSATGGETATTEAESEADPDGVARLAYDLPGTGRGGFTWDPSAAAASTGEAAVQHWVYGALLRPAADGSLVPDLAESTSVPDPNTIEISIRDGVTLPDGSPFDADLVKTVVDANLARPGLPAFGAEFYKLSAVEVVDPLTVRLTIPDGTAPSWHDTFLPGPEMMIVPPGTDFDLPSGAGPFRVTEYEPGQHALLEKNPDYWDAESIQVAAVELVSAPDVNAATGALNADQADWARIDPVSIDAVGSLEVLPTPDPTLLTTFTICKSQAPFDDPQVRQALSMAIDREAIGEALFAGTASPAWDLWPQDHPFHNPELDEVYAYDPEAAQDLLAEAGYPDGFEFDMMAIPVSGMNEVAQIVQQQWGQIGVTANILPTSNYVNDFYVLKRAPVGLVPSTGAGGTGKLRQWVGTSIGNTCAYNDPELNALAQDLASVSSTSDEAVDLWHEVQDLVVGDALSIIVLFQSQLAAYDADTLGGVVTNIGYANPMPEIRGLYVKA